MNAWRSLFATPAREAAAWIVLALSGVAIALGGVWLFVVDDDGGGATRAASAGRTPARTATATPVRTATETPSPTPTETPSPTATPEPSPTPAPRRTTSGSTSSGPVATQPPAEPAPAPRPQITTGTYCPPPPGPGSAPNAVLGLLRIGGEPAPAGTTVSLAFDGVIGPSVATAEAGGYRVLWSIAGGDCVNRAGTALGVVVNGQLFMTGKVAGSSEVIRHDVEVP